MNILSCEEMKQKEKKLLLLYNQGNIKFKINLQELIQTKNMKNDLFCFKKSNPQIHLRIQKLVPLHKRVQSINLDEEQNGLFKVLTYISLFIIYKRRDSFSDYLKEHLKCSLYSDDIDLMEIRNNSFNKKMKSDTIKSVIAMFFKEIDYLLQTQIVKKHKIKPGELIAFALQSNDIVVQGFHLFYRKIMATLQVENANNCIQDVNPHEAFQNFIQYFEIDCRTFNKLYLFYEAGIFVAQIQSQALIFGRYYQNQLFFQQTSDQEQQLSIKNIPKIQLSLQRKSISKSIEIEKDDVKIFNFLLDPNGQSINSSFADNKSTEAVTPSFQLNEEFKFGKTSITIENTMNKIKDRIHNLEIHQISSEEQEVQIKNQNSQSLNRFVTNYNVEENRFLDLNFDDSFNQSYDNTLPTPMLGFGGNDFLSFEKREMNSKTIKNQENKNNKQSSNQIITGKTVIFSKKNELIIQTNQIKQSAIRRKTYQEQNSNRSNCQENIKKSELKTSKNQIKVIDQTKSKISQVNTAENSKKISDEFLLNVKKINMTKCQQNSSYSNCTCHQEKKSRIKLSSKTVEIQINFKEKRQSKLEDFGRFVSIENISNSLKKYSQLQATGVDLKLNLPKSISRKQLQKYKGEVPKSKSPGKEQKSQQFLIFLKKDKSELIKKLTEKRIAKNQEAPLEKGVNIFSQHSDNNNQTHRKFVKQSMFVGSYHFHNPQKVANKKFDKIRSISPRHSIDRNPMNKFNIRGRLKTPPNTLRNEFGSEEANVFKKEKINKVVSKERQKNDLQKVDEYNSPRHQINFTNSTFRKHQFSAKSPTSKINNFTAIQVHSPPKLIIKPSELYNRK